MPKTFQRPTALRERSGRADKKEFVDEVGSFTRQGLEVVVNVANFGAEIELAAMKRI